MPSASPSIPPADLARVQTYLRALFGSERITVEIPRTRGASIEVKVGGEFVATLHRDEEAGEVSYALTMSILEEDLPPPAKPR